MNNKGEPTSAKVGAKAIQSRIDALPAFKTQDVRAVRRDFSKQLAKANPDFVMVLALNLLKFSAFEFRFIAYELIQHHLNNKTRSGTGDARRTLEICRLLLDDRDPMIVKALSWALRELAKRDQQSVRGFLESERDKLASQVLREVENKLTTGLKNPRPAQKC